jgi:hypothetical protein
VTRGLLAGTTLLGDDPAGLQHAFDGFAFRGNIRGACQVPAFVANVWALASIDMTRSAAHRSAVRA